MPTYLTYPASLPMPKDAPFRRADRKVMPGAYGELEVRAIQRDRTGVQNVVFPTFNDEEAAEFYAWWKGTLSYGGARFSAIWPMPEGIVPIVRRFIGPPKLQYAGAGFWRVSAEFEVFGVNEPPILPLLIFLLHFNGDLDDVAKHLFEADDVITDAAPNGFAINTATPMFGTGSGSWVPIGQNSHVRSGPYSGINLGAHKWQLEGFIRPRTDGAVADGGTIFYSGSFQAPYGNLIHGNPQGGQIGVVLLPTGEITVEYATTVGSAFVPRIVPATPTLITIDNATVTHWAVVSDVTSIRLYVNGALANEAPGIRPADIARDSKHRFFPGTRYTGGIPPNETYAGARLHADMDEMRLIRDVTYTGASITVPTPPLTSRP